MRLRMVQFLNNIKYKTAEKSSEKIVDLFVNNFEGNIKKIISLIPY